MAGKWHYYFAGAAAALAFVTAELVTDALKYGRGTVSVRLATDGNVLRLAVEDEGDGFPESYPTPQGCGSSRPTQALGKIRSRWTGPCRLVAS
jgi:two-component sensor histidine kinase